MRLRTVVLAVAIAAIAAGQIDSVRAQVQKADPADAAAIENCLKQERGRERDGTSCIGIVADPCLATREGKTTAGAVACYNREHLVWEDLVNRAHDQLRVQLEAPLWGRLRDGQRIWLEARKQTCDFYWDFFRSPMAGPESEGCYNRETAQRALYLRFFLDRLKK